MWQSGGTMSESRFCEHFVFKIFSVAAQSTCIDSLQYSTDSCGRMGERRREIRLQPLEINAMFLNAFTSG
jgi:hypothetical protein